LQLLIKLKLLTLIILSIIYVIFYMIIYLQSVMTFVTDLLCH